MGRDDASLNPDDEAYLLVQAKNIFLHNNGVINDLHRWDIIFTQNVDVFAALPTKIFAIIEEYTVDIGKGKVLFWSATDCDSHGIVFVEDDAMSIYLALDEAAAEVAMVKDVMLRDENGQLSTCFVQEDVFYDKWPELDAELRRSRYGTRMYLPTNYCIFHAMKTFIKRAYNDESLRVEDGTVSSDTLEDLWGNVIANNRVLLNNMATSLYRHYFADLLQ